MSAIRRIISVSVASATVIGLIMPVGDAPPAMAAACSAPEANVPPPAGMPNIPSPGPVAPPTGRRPRGANDNAPLPKLGPLISSLLKPTVPGQKYSAPMVPQAGVVPPQPNPPPPATGVNGNPWGYDFNAGNVIYAPDPNFCAYFNCIKNFPNGRGYVVECNDTMYSKSGGIQGACSYHNGVMRPLYSH